MVDLNERKRKVDIEKLTPESVDEISQQLGQKLKEIVEKAAKEANDLLGIYGLATKIVFLEPFDKNNPPKSQE